MCSNQVDPVREAARAMTERLDDLSNELTESVWKSVPSYSSVLLGRDDLHGYVRANLVVVLKCLSEDARVSVDALATARQLGEHRALQGVPIDALIRSFRTAERTTVEQFTRFYGLFAQDFAGQRAGAAKINDVLDRIEAVALDTYRSTQLRLAVHYDSTGGDLVSKIASGEEVSADDLNHLAGHLHIDPAQPHLAIAARATHDADRGALGQIRHHVTSRLLKMTKLPVLTGLVRETMVFLVPVTDGERSPVKDALSRALSPPQCRYDVVAGMGAISDGLAKAGSACRQAMDAVDIALRTGQVRSVVNYDDVVIDVLLAHDRSVAKHLQQITLGPIEDQEHLLQTLEAYFAAGQSTPATSRALLVHQNTVVYRLRRVKELTGRDVRNTGDLAMLILALRARHLQLGDTSSH